MSRELPTPTTYLITSGRTTRDTTPASEEFRTLVALVRAAVAARISLVQLREKNLRPRTLYELTVLAAQLTNASDTRLLVNDRADIARAANADGVHLTTQSLDAATIRRTFGTDFLVGVSAHNIAEARAARDGGADFATFGPIFDTPSKRQYGPPTGLQPLREAAHALAPFPLVALGGITVQNARATIHAGAHGLAAIRLFGDADNLAEVVRAIQREAT